MKTCEGIKGKKNHYNNYKERKNKIIRYISQTKSCEKEKKNEQLKATHWSPAWVMK
jgi:hypothetical protein